MLIGNASGNGRGRVSLVPKTTHVGQRRSLVIPVAAILLISASLLIAKSETRVFSVDQCEQSFLSPTTISSYDDLMFVESSLNLLISLSFTHLLFISNICQFSEMDMFMLNLTAILKIVVYFIEIIIRKYKEPL